MHSALKRNGVPLYKLARQGLEVDRAPRDIIVRSLVPVELKGDQLVVDTVVSKGTYIRVLAENIGEALGCGAHLTALRRRATGGFDLEQAVTFTALDDMPIAARDAVLLRADSLAMALPEIHLDAVTSKSLQNGQNPRISQELSDHSEYRVYGPTGRFVGVALASMTGESGTSLTAVRLMSPIGYQDENT